MIGELPIIYISGIGFRPTKFPVADERKRNNIIRVYIFLIRSDILFQRRFPYFPIYLSINNVNMLAGIIDAAGSF